MTETFSEYVQRIHGIKLSDPQLSAAQRILDGKDKNESSLRRMIREYTETHADQKSNQNYDSLARQIRTMSVRSELYKVLKAELSARGWWKNRPRGKPGSF